MQHTPEDGFVDIKPESLNAAGQDFSSWLPFFLITIIILALLLLLSRSKRQKKCSYVKETEKRLDAAISLLKKDSVPLKESIAELSLALREHMGARLSFNGTDKTNQEIIEEVRNRFDGKHQETFTNTLNEVLSSFEITIFGNKRTIDTSQTIDGVLELKELMVKRELDKQTVIDPNREL